MYLVRFAACNSGLPLLMPANYLTVKEEEEGLESSEKRRREGEDCSCAVYLCTYLAGLKERRKHNIMKASKQPREEGGRRRTENT